ncbi:Phosphatidylinositol transfer protein 3 [Bienertia sinuspersici]
MSTNVLNSASNIQEKSQSYEEQLKKIDEVRTAISPIPEKLSRFCSDASIARYLRARNWNVKKATKMLKDSLKWRLEFKPEQIRWEEVATEAETGKTYRSTAVDKNGRPVLIMRPCRQGIGEVLHYVVHNSKSVAGQIKHLVYCMENAILNLPPNQEQMVWLIDFINFNLSNVSLKAAKETAHVLQNHYPERLGVAILYNPPRFFEQFYKVVKPFLEPKTRKKVKFVYDDDVTTKKIMEELFEMDQLESAFGGNISESFDIEKYTQKMKEDDEKMHSFWEEGNDAPLASNCNGFMHESSTSLDNSPSEEEEEEPDDRCTSSSSTAKGSPDAGLAVAAMSIEDCGHVKA